MMIQEFLSENIPLLILLVAGMVFSVVAKKLTIPGAIAGGVIGFILFAGTGYYGVAMLAVFFILGTLATSWKKAEKQQWRTREIRDSRRTAGQVIANSGMAGLLALLCIADPAHYSLYVVMMAASIASATGDTLSSELGILYGRRFVNILTGKKDTRGLDGVISLEGLLIGVTASFAIAVLFYAGFGGGIPIVFIITFCGLAGNMADSVLGAWLERKGRIGNNMVNFLNTLIAAVLAVMLLFV